MFWMKLAYNKCILEVDIIPKNFNIDCHKNKKPDHSFAQYLLYLLLLT